MNLEILVKDYRGGLEDLLHPGIISIVDYKGNVLYALGDTKRLVFSRSSAKPIQAISVVESGAIDEFGITEKELALIASSHSGEEIHEEAVCSILRKANVEEKYLKCGTHLPLAKYRADEFIKKGITPTEIQANCSGKHSGMLITSQMLGYSLDDYWIPDHPVQQKIVENFGYMCGVEPREIQIGIDGCGVPVHALPMEKLAYGYARLANPVELPKERQETIKRITDAMVAYPEMVGGTDRICTDLMKKFGDRLFAKSGANAFYNIGIKEKGIGIAIKMLDGSSDNIPMIILDTLMKLGVIEEKELEDFNKVHLDYNVYNHRKEVVGEKKLAYNLNDYKCS